MKWLLFAFVVGCAHGVSDPVDELRPTTRELEEQRSEVPERVVCLVVGVDRVSDCTVYTLDCDGETDYALRCENRPIGVITDPPRPIRVN